MNKVNTMNIGQDIKKEMEMLKKMESNQSQPDEQSIKNESNKVLETLEIGKEKEVDILKIWKGRTKKDFLNLFKTKKDNISEPEILNIILYPYIVTKGNHLTIDEEQYVLMHLRDLSVKTPLIFYISCNECDNPIEIRKNSVDLIKYTPNQFPEISKSENIEIEWVNQKVNINKLIKHFNDELPDFLEILNSIERINGKSFGKFSDIIEYFEDLDISDVEWITQEYERLKSKISLETRETCKVCNHTEDYYLDSLPGFFDPLLPKELADSLEAEGY
jgi:DNA-directed RNA polymerase subunit M/transcription elongation factor TFIIS